MRIGPTPISGDRTFFIAEAGVNHNGDLERAEALIDAAEQAGADAVKFQTFSADRLVTSDAPKADYQTAGTGDESQYEMLKRYELDSAAHERLLDACSDSDITFLSTPYDPHSADLLADLGVPAIKVGSGELDNHPLLAHIAELGLPMIVSTGMGTMEEVLAAHNVIYDIDSDAEVAFLHCTSAYPCSMEDVNLRAMQTMASELKEPVGYSDHTVLPEMPAIAVGAGARIVEKHFTLDSSLPGPDHEASLEPDKLERSVALTRHAATALGRPEKRPTEVEMKNSGTIRKSLHAASDVQPDTTLEEQHIAVTRPADGISPRHLDRVIGSTTTGNIGRGDPIRPEDVKGTVEEGDV